MSLQERFQKVLNEKFAFQKNAWLYLAISGGRDSMALLHLLMDAGYRPNLLHCNFKLRGNESDEDELFLKAFAKREGLEFHSQSFDVNAEMKTTGKNIQETARTLRYDWFSAFLDSDNKYLLTAHHLDDSIETFFINLLRGTGLRGLAGIPERRGNIVRPLGSFSSVEIAAYVEEKNIPFRNDSSNDTEKYLRNRIRHHLVPELMDMEPGLHEKMLGLFAELRGHVASMDERANKFRTEHFKRDGDLDSIEIAQLDFEKSDLFLQAIFEYCGIRRNNVDQLRALLKAETGKKLILPEHEIFRDRDMLIVRKAGTPDQLHQQILNFPFTTTYCGRTILMNRVTSNKIPDNDDSIQRIDLRDVNEPLTLRNWKSGDRISPLGLNGSKLVSDILTDKKLSTVLRSQQLVLVDTNNRIIAILGLVISEDVKLKSDSGRVLEIVVK